MPAMKELVKGTDRYRHYINGEWELSTVKEWLEVENPATGARSSPRCRAAARTTPTGPWSAPIARSRHGRRCRRSRGRELLKKLARLILENRERLAQVVIAEQGKPLQEARGEIEGTALYLTPRRGGGAPHHRRHPPVRQSATNRSGSSASPMASSSP